MIYRLTFTVFFGLCKISWSRDDRPAHGCLPVGHLDDSRFDVPEKLEAGVLVGLVRTEMDLQFALRERQNARIFVFAPAQLSIIICISVKRSRISLFEGERKVISGIFKNSNSSLQNIVKLNIPVEGIFNYKSKRNHLALIVRYFKSEAFLQQVAWQ